MEIRIYKGEQYEGKCFSIGLGGEKSRTKHIEHTSIFFPQHFCHAIIRDGEIATPTEGILSVEDVNTYEPIPAEEIAVALLRANTYSRGRDKLVGYGEKGDWFFDYSPEIHEFFEKYRLPIPADGKSHFDKVEEIALKSLEERGLLRRGIGGANPDGQGAIEAAKLKKQQEELEATKAEIAELKAALAANQVKTEEIAKSVSNSPEIPEGSETPKKTGRKTKEEVKA